MTVKLQTYVEGKGLSWICWVHLIGQLSCSHPPLAVPSFKQLGYLQSKAGSPNLQGRLHLAKWRAAMKRATEKHKHGNKRIGPRDDAGRPEVQAVCLVPACSANASTTDILKA